MTINGYSTTLDMSLNELKKSDVSLEVNKALFWENLLSFLNFQEIYTNGSKMNSSVGCSVLLPAGSGIGTPLICDLCGDALSVITSWLSVQPYK